VNICETERDTRTVIDDLSSELSDAVQYYWETRSGQGEEQRESEDSTRGRRAEVLGGQQMDSSRTSSSQQVYHAIR